MKEEEEEEEEGEEEKEEEDNGKDSRILYIKLQTKTSIHV